MLKVYVKNCDDPLYVEYSCFSGCKGKMYLRNGDPGYPDEPPEIDTIAVYAIDDSSTIDLYDLLSDDVRDQIETRCLEDESERDE